MAAMVENSTDNPLQNVTFPSGGGTAHGYLALPESGVGPGVVVIQEWWGLTSHIADVVNRLAAEGFVALAPDLYGGTTTHDADEAGKLMQQLPVDRAATDLGGAVDFLLGHDAVVGRKVGAVGFCMGGGFVLVLAAQQGD
jgi:carboxymethylenebutenolidase